MQNILKGRLLYNLGRAGVKAIKEAQMKTSKKGERIRQGINFTIGVNSVTFYLNKIGGYHNNGVRRHKMRYLQKAKRPIPIKLKSGELIFRWASPKSMAKPGSWTHPGISAKKFLQAGLKQMRNDFKNRLNTELHKYLKKKL